MRRNHVLLVILAGLLVVPSLLWSQPRGGGFRANGPIASDPEGFFNKLSEGKDFIVMTELDPMRQQGLRRIFTEVGITSDRVTRDQFRDAVNLKKQTMPPVAAPDKNLVAAAPTSPTAAPGAPQAASPAPTGGPPGDRGGPPSDRSGPGGQRGPGGSGRESRLEDSFRQLDKNNDGQLSFDEMPEALQREREVYDVNHDGFIDLAEYKAFVKEVMSSRGPNSTGPNNGKRDPSDSTNPEDTSKPSHDDAKPVVYRAGRLPKGLPEWFVRLDKQGDCDGQVALWEARYDKDVMESFTQMDLNGDGLVTAEEVLRYLAKKKKLENPTEVAAAAPPVTPTAPQPAPYAAPFGPPPGFVTPVNATTMPAPSPFTRPQFTPPGMPTGNGGPPKFGDFRSRTPGSSKGGDGSSGGSQWGGGSGFGGKRDRGGSGSGEPKKQ